MSIRWLPRELGIVLTCNGCGAARQTANIIAKSNRAEAKRGGWGRGLRKGYKRHDFCSTCMPTERALFEKQKADRAAELLRRDELKKAKASAKALPKKPRKKKSAQPSTPSPSPSADSAPAPAPF